MSYTLDQYRAELVSALTLDVDDEMWGQEELDLAINQAIRKIWLWLVAIDPQHHIVRDQAYALVASSILEITEYDAPSGLYSPLTLDSERSKYPKIAREERHHRKGWYIEGSTLFVSRITNSAGNQGTFPRDFSNSVWTATDGTVGTESVACPDQTFRTTNTFTATDANATLQQALSSLSEGYWSAVVYLRRKTGTGTVSVTLDGSNYTEVTLTSNWKRFIVSSSVSSADFGVKLATSGDAVYIDSAEVKKPDLVNFRYLSWPDALSLGSSTDTLPDDETRTWVRPLAKVLAIYKEKVDNNQEYLDMKAIIQAELRELYPREDRSRTESMPYNGTYDGFNA